MKTYIEQLEEIRAIHTEWKSAKSTNDKAATDTVFFRLKLRLDFLVDEINKYNWRPARGTPIRKEWAAVLKSLGDVQKNIVSDNPYVSTSNDDFDKIKGMLQNLPN